MIGPKDDVIRYRLQRAKGTLEDAKLLADNQRWNSAINRLYYLLYHRLPIRCILTFALHAP